MSREDFPVGYVAIGARIPTSVEIVQSGEISANRRDLDPQSLGDYWIDSMRSAVLRVPSAVVPNEFNYLLNPRHGDFARIIPELPVPFTFDERLFQDRR